MFVNPRDSLEVARHSARLPVTAREVLKDVWAELDGFIQVASRTYTCPACRAAYQPVLFAAEHGLSCAAHPAVVRAQAAWEELGALTAMAAALGKRFSHPQPPPPLPRTAIPNLKCLARPREEVPLPHFRFTLKEQYFDALRELEGLPRTPRSEVTSRAHALEVLEVGIAEWEAYVARRVTPCPGCAEPVELHLLPAHLFSCPHHPELARAAVIEDALEQIRGPVPMAAGRLIREKLRSRVALLKLAGASYAFMQGLSDCDIGKARVDESREARWKRVVAESVEVLGGSW